MTKTATEAIRVTKSLKKYLDLIAAEVVQAKAERPTYSSILEAAFGFSDHTVIVAALVEIWRIPGREETKAVVRRVKREYKQPKRTR